MTKGGAPKKPKASKSKKGVKPTAPEPVVIIELSLPPLDLTLETTDGSGEINEAALQTIAEEYTLAAIESALPSAKVKSITITTTAVTSSRRRTMRRLETFQYNITGTVEYDGTSVSGEDLEQELSNAFEGDGRFAFITTVQQAGSTIGATVTGNFVGTTPTPAPMTAPPTPSVVPSSMPSLSPSKETSGEPSTVPTSSPSQYPSK